MKFVLRILSRALMSIESYVVTIHWNSLYNWSQHDLLINKKVGRCNTPTDWISRAPDIYLHVPYPTFDHKKESSFWDNSNEWSNVGYSKEITFTVFTKYFRAAGHLVHQIWIYLDRISSKLTNLTHSVLVPPYGVGKYMPWMPSAVIWHCVFKYIRSIQYINCLHASCIWPFYRT